jgi:hypothetical protein
MVARMIEQARQAIADFIAPKAGKKADKTSEEILKGIKERVDSVDNTYADMDDTINLAYLKGKQWVSWNSSRSQVYEPPKESGKTRYVANRLIAIFQKAKSRIFKSRVLMEVMPATSEEEDIASAKQATRVAEWLEYDKRLQKRDEQVVSWGLVTRIGFMHPYWNPALGDLAAADGTRQGDIDYDVLSCFEVVYDSSATCWEDVRWVCMKKVRDTRYVEQVYGVKVKAEQGLTSNNIYDSRMSFSAALSDPIKYTALENHVRVYEYWEKPCADYPRGRRVTYCETHPEPLFTADDIGFGDADDTERELPFFPFVAIDVPGSVAGTNKVAQCRPMQREYNRTRSQLIDNKDLTAYPKLAVETGTITEDWDNEIGGMVEYTDKAPTYIQPPVAGADAHQNLQNIAEEMDYVSGQSQVSHGRTPRDASGYLVELLIEQDDTELALTIDNYIHCKQAYMSYSLKMLRFMYTAERTLRVVGKDGVTVFGIQGDSIKSFDVRIQRGSLLSGSRPARRAEVMNLINAGVLNPQTDRDDILRHLEFGMLDEIYNEAEQDQKQARKEQIGWENGVLPPPDIAVRDFFNHRVHIREHNRWRKTDKYEALPPKLMDMVNMHVQMHEQFLMLQTMQQIGMNPPPVDQKSAGTPHNPDKLAERIGNGDIVGNPMQGREQGVPNGEEVM